MRRLAVWVAAGLLTGCASSEQPTRPEPQDPPQPSPTSAALADDSAAVEPPEPGTVPPRWLGTRPLEVGADGFGVSRETPAALRERRFTLPDTVSALPGAGFASRVRRAPRSVIARSTWQPGCPVRVADLAWVRVAFWGFDGRRHTGELLVHASVAADVVSVFRGLFARRFPLEEVRVTRRDELDAKPTGDGNNTGAFVCRPGVGQTTYSQHAYGLALDLNPFQNPYVRGTGAARLVLPELASAYVDRGRPRPGMVLDGSEIVAAFAGIGWEWGGDWQTLKDYQHFSLTGR